MPTVYHKIQQFYQRDKFRFDERTKKRIGVRIASLWKELHGSELKPPLVESEEDSGTYLVYNYPEDFGTIIFQAIRNEHKDILQRSREKRFKLVLKDTAPPTSPPLVVITSTKLRNRISVKAKPVWKNK